MELKIKDINFKDIARDIKLGLSDNSSTCKGIEINKILKHSVNISIKPGRTPLKTNNVYWDDGIYEFLNMQDIDDDLYILKKQCSYKITRKAVEENNNLLMVPKESLLISNAMTIGLAFISQREVYINQNLFWVDIDEDKYNKKFLMWYFNVVLREKFSNQYGSKYLSKDELGRVVVPAISKQKQDEIVGRVEVLENEMRMLKISAKDESDIINEVFKDYMDIDIDNVNKIKCKNMFNMSFSDCSRDNYDMRVGHRYSNPASRLLINELKKNNHGKIKEFLEVPMVLGASIRQNDYDEQGCKYYISMASIKTWQIDLTNSSRVSNEFYNANINKIISKGDILIARSGEGTIGKVAYVDRDLDGVFCDFIIRIRPNKNINSKFLYYYLRSEYMQLLVEFNKKGLGNNTNIFPNEIKDFPLVHYFIETQAEIIKIIEDRIEIAKNSKEKISSIKKEIKNQISRA
jgi:type I restriction enzyme S subunit